MHRASRMIVNWSRNNGKRKLPNSWHLTKAKLCLKSGSYCHMLGKAWHTTVVLQFLASFLPSTNVDPLIKSAVWAADSVIGLLTESRAEGIFLSPEEISQVQHVGHFLLDSYLWLHRKYTGFCVYKLFNLRPKVRLFDHLIASAKKLRNPLCSATFMDEDWIRLTMQLASKCHKRTVQSATLQRYCAGDC